MLGEEVAIIMDVLTDVLMDTNTVSAMLKQDKQVLKNVTLANTAKRKIFFNTITYYETKRGLLATKATRKMQDFDEMRQRYETLGTDNDEPNYPDYPLICIILFKGLILLKFYK
jgi:hypothetical protein